MDKLFNKKKRGYLTVVFLTRYFEHVRCRVGEPRENPGELGDRTNTNLSTAQSLQGPTSHGTCNSPTKELSMPCIKVHYENIGRE